MRQKKTIQIISAWVMMLIFAFSITPKKFLHDLIADHTDDVSIVANDGHDHIDHHGFKCDCDNLVTTSPFAVYSDVISFHTPTFYTRLLVPRVTAVITTPPSFYSLRGPPVQG